MARQSEKQSKAMKIFHQHMARTLLRTIASNAPRGGRRGAARRQENNARQRQLAQRRRLRGKHRQINISENGVEANGVMARARNGSVVKASAMAIAYRQKKAK
jgi:hypothetical protein